MRALCRVERFWAAIAVVEQCVGMVGMVRGECGQQGGRPEVPALLVGRVCPRMRPFDLLHGSKWLRFAQGCTGCTGHRAHVLWAVRGDE